ncbi:DUF3027 domain-containing protein [Timonella sp. A28]|uniref:DUF3027 domain-containing protein n=1 Tax=Timonella sp. A28 TaxID=3442640 RepID=UPI003EBEF439
MNDVSVTASKGVRAKYDSVLGGAVDLARAAALDEADNVRDVGEHVGSYMLADRFMAHEFVCTMRGYVGWRWTVTLARVPRGRVATVCEVSLLPSPEAILAPAWLPWEQRLQPGDLGPGDVLPFKEDDPRLVEGYVASGNEDEDAVAIGELALARARILSQTGRDETAKRWFEGSQGPRSAGSLQAAASCGSCGFFVPLQGALGQVFGVCTNEWSEDDGKVVAFGHGCGAHSQTDVPHRASEWPDNNPIIDEVSIEQVSADEIASVEPVSESASEPASERDAVDEVSEESDAQTPREQRTAREVAGEWVITPESIAADLAGEPSVPVDATPVDVTLEGIAASLGEVVAPSKKAKNARRSRKGKPRKATKTESVTEPSEGVPSVKESGESAGSEGSPLALELPQAKTPQEARPREDVLSDLDRIAQSLPQRSDD